MYELFSAESLVIITSNDAVEGYEWRTYVQVNWHKLTKRDTKILILAGIHGYLDGQLGDVDLGLLEDKLQSSKEILPHK